MSGSQRLCAPSLLSRCHEIVLCAWYISTQKCSRIEIGTYLFFNQSSAVRTFSGKR